MLIRAVGTLTVATAMWTLPRGPAPRPISVDADSIPAPRQITTGDREWFWPEWSPDGRELLAAGATAGDWDIYVMKPDGSGLRALGASPASEIHPSWSPTGDFIVFDSDRESKRFHVFLVERDGTGLRRLTADTSMDGAAEASPDGKHIVFGSSRTGVHLLYVIGRDGTGERPLVSGAVSAFAPHWSPDGKRIAYMRGARPSDVHVVTFDGEVTRPMANSPANEAGAGWSSDGTQFLFIRSDSVGNDLMIADSTGESVRQLTRVGGDIGWPSWCRDGKHAVFTVRASGNEDVYAVRVADGRVQRLTDHSARDTAPSCDARGRVVFASERVVKRHLFVVTIPE